MRDAADSDPWMDVKAQAPAASAEGVTARRALQIETIENVEPLDAQIGVFPKKTAPDVLHDALFGHAKPTEVEIAAAGGDAAKVPSMQTYAILDAAKVTNLQELLEDSGLEHRCLFKGAAYDDLRNVAPWIVRLEEGNTFTRNLFTHSDTCWCLWESEPGIYVRSQDSIDGIWRHFRKFTRVQNPEGKWYYLRFWDKAVLNAARRGGCDKEFYQRIANNITIIWRSPEPEMPNLLFKLTYRAA